MDTSSYHYQSRRPDQAGLEARIKAICETRVRYGYRRVHVLLEREGWRINIKKTYRIYNALGLQLRNKTPKRRVDPPPFEWTPMLAFRSWRGVSDECSTPGVSGIVQARGR